MASTPATGAIGVELQAAGENLNTWGDPKLNNALQILVNLAHGWKAWTINGNYTVSETNYSTTNDTENAFIKLVAGTVAAAFNVTLPGRAKRLFMWNATSYAATVKLSATTGVTVPAGAFAIVATDGATDVYNVGPTHAGTTTQSSSANAYALWGSVEAAIAAASGLTAPFILETATDTTPNYHGAKHTVAFSSATTTQVSGLLSVQYSTQNAGAAEKHLMTVAPGYVGGFLNGGVQSSQFTPSQGTAYDVDCTAAGVTVALSSMTSVMIGQEIKLNNFGNYPMFLLGTVNGLTNLSIPTPQNGTYRYSSASWGWN